MGMRHIAVGYDGSRASEYAVRWAVHQAGARNTVVLLITACPPPMPPDRTSSEQRLAVLAQVFRLQDEAIERATVGLTPGQRPPVIGREVSVADPVAALCRAATQADLLVVGSDRDEGLGSGSVAGRVAARLSLRRRRSTRCPLIVIATPRIAAPADDAPAVTMPTFDTPPLHRPTSGRSLTRRIGQARAVHVSKVLVDR
jgi:nucleotide-binding universal stress UspA family protein